MDSSSRRQPASPAHSRISRAILPPPRMKTRRRLFGWLLTGCLLVLLLAQLIGNGPFTPAKVAFATARPHSQSANNTYQQFEQLAHQSAQHRPKPQWFQPPFSTPLSTQEQAFMKAKQTLPPSVEPPTMQPIRQTLSSAFLAGATGTQPLTLVSSDHHLQVQIPAGAFDLSHAVVSGSASHAQHPRPRPTPTPVATATPAPSPTATATPSAAPMPTGTPSASATPRAPPTATASPTPSVSPTPSASPAPSPSPSPAPGSISGPLTLVISEVHGHSAGEMNILAEYQVQLLTVQGQAITGFLVRHPITISYHYLPAEMTELDLDPTRIFLSWPLLAEASDKAHRSTAQDIFSMSNAPATQTLSVTSATFGPGPFVVSGDPQNQSPQPPNMVSVSGNSGQSSYSYPLQVAPAPDGFTPQLTLAIPAALPTSARASTVRRATKAMAGRSRSALSPPRSIRPPARAAPKLGTLLAVWMVSAICSFPTPTPTTAAGTSPAISPTCAFSRSAPRTVPPANPVSTSGTRRIPITSLAARTTRCNTTTIAACTSIAGTSTISWPPTTGRIPRAKRFTSPISRCAARRPARVRRPARPAAMMPFAMRPSSKSSTAPSRPTAPSPWPAPSISTTGRLTPPAAPRSGPPSIRAATTGRATSAMAIRPSAPTACAATTRKTTATATTPPSSSVCSACCKSPAMSARITLPMARAATRPTSTSSSTRIRPSAPTT